jgi:mono/diheme cytochrome c family protein
VGFALEKEFAVGDGSAVIHYDGVLHAVSGGLSKLAGIKDDGSVFLFDARTQKGASFQIPGASATAIDSGGRLVVAGKDGIWVQPLGELSSELQRAFDTKGAPVHGMVLSGSRVWFALGTELGALDPQGAYRTQGANVPADAQLFASPSGDIWTLSAGKLTRSAIPVSGDEAVWRKTVQPVYVKVCADCHAPGGSSGIDLSSYAAWSQRKALIYDRVVVKKNMPQGRTLDDADMMSIAAWSKP